MILAHVDYRRGERVLDTVPGFEVVRTGGGPPLPVQFGPAYRAVVLGERYCGGHQQRFEITCHDKQGRRLTRTIRMDDYWRASRVSSGSPPSITESGCSMPSRYRRRMHFIGGA